MADTLKRYFNGYIAASGGTDSATTAVGASGGVIRNIHICNTDTSARTVNISIGSGSSYSATTAIYSAFSIPASGVHVANVNIVMAAGDKLVMNASVGSKVVATISGVDV